MNRFMSLILAFILSGSFLVPVHAAEEGSLENFKEVYQYGDNTFADISDGLWYGKYVAKAYAIGLVQGRDGNVFGPGDPVTLAETVTLAARLHNIYHGGSGVFEQSEPWYRVYVDYALAKGIINGELDWEAEATRRDFAAILCRSLPASALTAISEVPDGAIPDVAASAPSAGEIYRLYRAGVLTGSDAEGTFYPDTNIARSAVAAIVSRMALQNMRVAFSLNPYKGPELPAREAKGEDYFSDACILGNSLVEGIRIYSGLKTMTYYSFTGMTVISAVSGSNYVLNSGWYGSALDAMAQYDYGKVYIELGINEIGFPVETFCQRYGEIIDRIKLDQPDADIYILSLTPVSRYKDSQGTFTMARVNAYNEGLLALAAEKEVYYINCCSTLAGDDGFLASGDTWDGVHFNIPKYAQWEELIRTHYAD